MIQVDVGRHDPGEVGGADADARRAPRARPGPTCARRCRPGRAARPRRGTRPSPPAHPRGGCRSCGCRERPHAPCDRRIALRTDDRRSQSSVGGRGARRRPATWRTACAWAWAPAGRRRPESARSASAWPAACAAPGIPTSHASAALARSLGIPLGRLRGAARPGVRRRRRGRSGRPGGEGRRRRAGARAHRGQLGRGASWSWWTPRRWSRPWTNGARCRSRWCPSASAACSRSSPTSRPGRRPGLNDDGLALVDLKVPAGRRLDRHRRPRVRHLPAWSTTASSR